MTANPNAPHLGLVVEGLGDTKALPILMRNWLMSQGVYNDILGKPVPCHGRDKAKARGGIEGYVATAAARPGCRAVIVVLDAESDMACQLGPKFLARATSVARGHPVLVALAERTFEDWIYASAETLKIGIDEYHPKKSGLGAIVSSLKPVTYTKPTWQPRLTTRMDIELARSRDVSLDRLLARCDEIRRTVGL